MNHKSQNTLETRDSLNGGHVHLDREGNLLDGHGITMNGVHCHSERCLIMKFERISEGSCRFVVPWATCVHEDPLM